MDSCAPQNRHGSRQTSPAVRKCSENPLLAGRHAGQGGLAAPWPSALPLAQALVGKWPAGAKGVGRPYGFLSVGKNDDLRFEQLSLPNGAPQETDFRPLNPKSGGISRPFGTQLTRNHPPFLGLGTGSGLFPKHRLCRGACKLWPPTPYFRHAVLLGHMGGVRLRGSQVSRP